MTPIISLDCEMVKCGEESVLARISIVNYNGQVLFDEYIRPTQYISKEYNIISISELFDMGERDNEEQHSLSEDIWLVRRDSKKNYAKQSNRRPFFVEWLHRYALLTYNQSDQGPLQNQVSQWGTQGS